MALFHLTKGEGKSAFFVRIV